MKNNLIETIMGAVVLAIAGYFLVFAYSGSGLKNNYEVVYKARFDRVDGLQIGSDVRISGVKVGLVSDITVDPGTFIANVQLKVREDLRIPADSSAEIVTDGLLGGKYLALVPGGDDNYLESGQEILYTQASVSLEAMIGQLIFSKKDEKAENKDGLAEKEKKEKGIMPSPATGQPAP